MSESAIDLLNNVFSHLLRNALDHGIEPPEERINQGKQGSGSINIVCNMQETETYLSISDDGKGVNLARLYNKGLEQNLWESNAAPSNEDIAALIFHSGLSNKESLSDISGRGVGMELSILHI